MISTNTDNVISSVETWTNAKIIFKIYLNKGKINTQNGKAAQNRPRQLCRFCQCSPANLRTSGSCLSRTSTAGASQEERREVRFPQTTAPHTQVSLIDRADSCIALPAAVTDCLPPAVSQCGRTTSTPVDIYACLASTSSRGGWSMRNSALVAECGRSDCIKASVISLRMRKVLWEALLSSRGSSESHWDTLAIHVIKGKRSRVHWNEHEWPSKKQKNKVITKRRAFAESSLLEGVSIFGGEAPCVGMKTEL